MKQLCINIAKQSKQKSKLRMQVVNQTSVNLSVEENEILAIARFNATQQRIVEWIFSASTFFFLWLSL